MSVKMYRVGSLFSIPYSPDDPLHSEAVYVRASDYDALAARCAELEKDAERYREALNWIVVVNAMDYEYRRIARNALADSGGQP